MSGSKTEETSNEVTPGPGLSTLRLSDIDRLTLENLSLSIQLATIHEQQAVERKRTLLEKVDPQGVLAALDAKIMAERSIKADLLQKQTELRARISESFGLDLKDYSYDSVTGALHYIGPVKEPTDGAAQVSVSGRDGSNPR